MDLEKMLSMQKELDERIIREKGLEGKDLFPNTVLALQVELAEFANEGRWFKHWSNDQEPRYTKTEWEIIKNSPIKNEFITNLDAEANYAFVELVERKPLIEEFVDGVHFFLSIAIQKGWEDCLYISEEAIEETREEGFDGGLTGIFLEMLWFLNKCSMEGEGNPETDPWQRAANLMGVSRKAYLFRMAWALFITIGLVGFNFTLEQIEQAYMEKNAVNHDRQDGGY
jgi:dimeric dUTPase (all-alpha-NTP-PPase superfamily)